MNGAILAALAAVVLVATPARAQQPGTAPAPPRPKVVLVLSGGGARGAAHLGALKILEEYRVPVDLIVGTSMGSIVGGLYAAGWSVEEIETKLTTTDWSSVFSDRVPRRYRTFRRKTDDARFLVPLKMRFKDWRPYLPPAVLGGQRLELLVKGLELEATRERDFDLFPIPFRAVASDLATGEVVVLGRGSLAEAMQASMALPGVFPPVEIDGKALADGGIAANFPIRVARDLGAGVVIGVDITSPLRLKEQLGNILTRLDQVTTLLTNAHKNQDLAALRPGDVVMTPDLADLTFSDFARAAEAIAAGEAAARAHEAELRRFAVGDDAWAAYRARHRRVGASDRIVDEIRITNTGPLKDEIVAKRLHVAVGEPLDEPELASELLGLYSLDAFGPIRHDLRREDGKNVLTIETSKKPYGRNSLQFGFSLNDNFQGDTGFNIAVSHLFNPINRRGGEWRNVIQVGENELVATEFYQPVDAGMSWFVEPRLELSRDTLRRYDDTGHALAEFRVRSRRARVGFGRVLGRWGAAGVGAFRTVDEGRLRIGVGFDPTPRADDGGVFAGFRVDTLDSVTWPRDGTRVEVGWLRSIESLGADRAGSNVRAEVGQVVSFGRNVLLGSVEAGTSFNGLPSLTNAFRLGGFLRLSGLAQNELLGEDGGVMRFLYFRELTRFNLGSITQRMYAGVSIEAGNVYNQGDAVTWASLRRAGSIYAGADTIIGPAYVGFGFAEGGRTTFFLIIGQRF